MICDTERVSLIEPFSARVGLFYIITFICIDNVTYLNMANAGRILNTWLTVIVLFFVYLLVYMCCDSVIVLIADVLSQMLPAYANLNTWIMTIWTFTPIIVLFLICAWGVITSLFEEYDSDFGAFK